MENPRSKHIREFRSSKQRAMRMRSPAEFYTLNNVQGHSTEADELWEQILTFLIQMQQIPHLHRLSMHEEIEHDKLNSFHLNSNPKTIHSTHRWSCQNNIILFASILWPNELKIDKYQPKSSGLIHREIAKFMTLEMYARRVLALEILSSKLINAFQSKISQLVN